VTDGSRPSKGRLPIIFHINNWLSGNFCGMGNVGTNSIHPQRHLGDTDECHSSLPQKLSKNQIIP
jgi:hypothetical protein